MKREVFEVIFETLEYAYKNENNDQDQEGQGYYLAGMWTVIRNLVGEDIKDYEYSEMIELGYEHFYEMACKNNFGVEE